MTLADQVEMAKEIPLITFYEHGDVAVLALCCLWCGWFEPVYDTTMAPKFQGQGTYALDHVKECHS